MIYFNSSFFVTDWVTKKSNSLHLHQQVQLGKSTPPPPSTPTFNLWGSFLLATFIILPWQFEGLLDGFEMDLSIAFLWQLWNIKI